MVIRKSTPTGAFIAGSSSSWVPDDGASVTSSSNEVPALMPIATQHSFPDTCQDIRRRTENRIEIPQLNIVLDSNERSQLAKEESPEEPLPVILQAGGSSRSTEELHTEFQESERPRLSTSEKATPRSSLDSGRSRDFWEEDLNASGETSGGPTRLQLFPRLDSASTRLRQQNAGPIIRNESTSDKPDIPRSFIRSNNPFRRKISDSGFISNLEHSADGPLKFKSPPETPVEMTANLSLADRPFSEFSTSYRPSDLNLNRAFQQQEPEPLLQTHPRSEPLRPFTLPPTSSLQNTTNDYQPSLIPVLPDDPERTRGRPLHPGFSNDSPGASEDSITNKGNTKPAIVADLQKELPSTPQPDIALLADIDAQPMRSVADFNHENAPSASTACQDPHLPDLPPPKPTRPSTSLSTAVGADIAMLKEQRNETYQIKHFNWFDHNSRTLRRSSMLTQNKNGPCPLLALVNALILDGETDSCSALGAALRTREQVSLGLIIESLMDELTSEGRGGQLTELPDVDELNRFLLMLHTGMTANPRLASPATGSPNLMDARNSSLHLPLSLNNDRTPGTFEDTQAIRLYGAFAIPLVHGWLAPRSDPARAAFTRSAQTYEDAQTIQFGEEELEDKLSREGLTPEEQQLFQDISSIKSFLDCYPTQITPFGLAVINESLFPGSKAILFRNDHFSTIYKHPESGQLFTLVTDAGYSDKDEVIWESLVDVSGQNSEFFSGDFRPVGNGGATNQQPQSELGGSFTTGVEQHSSQLHGLESATSTQQQQQQADADFAMALQLQEEEDARMEDSRRGSGANDAIPNRSSDPSNSRRLRDRDASRPAIPPRNTRNQGVNRPVDHSSDEAPPPAYEEAAKGKPYLPPTGHPHHPSFDGRSPTSVSSTPTHPPGPRAGQAYPRRTSAFQENSQFQSNSLLTRPHTKNSIGVAQSSARPRDRDKDCVVM